MNIIKKKIKKIISYFNKLVLIIFLINIITLIISGLANGLSQDNAALIKDMPEGTFYMEDDADETYNLSKVDTDLADEIIDVNEGATALSIQMGFMNDQKIGRAHV